MKNQKDKPTNTDQESSYIAYGLKIKSVIPIPQLQSICSKVADVVVCLNDFSLPSLKPTSLYRQGVEAQFNLVDKKAFLHWQGIASFQAQEGNQLLVMKAKDDIDLSILNLYLLSEALGLILHQKGYFLLHGSSVVVGNQTVIFLGTPGAGKSTIAGAFAQRGYAVIADDMVALEVTGTVRAIPAFPQLKLWENSVKGLNYDLRLTEPLFEGSRKQVIRNKQNFPHTSKFPVKAIYLLKPNSLSVEIRRLTAQEKIINLTRFFSCPHQLLSGNNLSRHFQQCQFISNQVSMFELSLPRKFTVFDSVIEKLITE